MSAVYAVDYCVAQAGLAKNSEDFASIQKLKLRIPVRADWQAVYQAGKLTERCMKNLEHGVVGFILGVACDAAVEDIQAAAEFMIEQKQLFLSHLSGQPEVKDKLWVYLTNIESIVNIVKRYFTF